MWHKLQCGLNLTGYLELKGSVSLVLKWQGKMLLGVWHYMVKWQDFGMRLNGFAWYGVGLYLVNERWNFQTAKKEVRV